MSTSTSTRATIQCYCLCRLLVEPSSSRDGSFEWKKYPMVAREEFEIRPQVEV
jgi:hypothetical protein